LNSENAINIQHLVNDELQPGITVVFPSTSSANKLVAYAPTGIANGNYAVAVIVEGKALVIIISR